MLLDETYTRRRRLKRIVLIGCVAIIGLVAGMVFPDGGQVLSEDSNDIISRSLIFFIGDGMGPEIVSIAKIYAEESLGKELNMVRLANTGTTGYMTTHSQDRLVTDSAASGTAMATGQKTNNGMVGMSPDGRICTNLLEEAVASGRAVGVVTTTSVTDATPASYLAHAASRGHHFGIAEQIVEGDATVVMGGGYWFFLPPERGKRRDGRNLAEEAEDRGFEVVFTREELEAAREDRLIGLFAHDAMPYEQARDAGEVPSLAEMTAKALDVLEFDPDGFFLVVEGGRIDHAEHDNRIADALADLLAFDAAIGLAMEYQEDHESLTIVISADHDCGGPAITRADYGYPARDDIDHVMSNRCEFVRWVSGHHTGTMVPVFVRGPGAERFSGIQDNTELHDDMALLLGL
jgi:alkaline phosphatase